MKVEILLDAAGGYEAEFAHSYNANVDHQAAVVCQDANPPKPLDGAGEVILSISLVLYVLFHFGEISRCDNMPSFFRTFRRQC